MEISITINKPFKTFAFELIRDEEEEETPVMADEVIDNEEFDINKCVICQHPFKHHYKFEEETKTNLYIDAHTDCIEANKKFTKAKKDFLNEQFNMFKTTGKILKAD